MDTKRLTWLVVVLVSLVWLALLAVVDLALRRCQLAYQPHLLLRRCPVWRSVRVAGVVVAHRSQGF